MDMTAWLWARVERRDAPAVLAHALSLAPTRDALLRHAAITRHWEHLARASAEAADIADHVGWSRSGPDAVTAICHWIAADRTLRSVPAADRAAPLASAALAAWAAPGELAHRLASTPALSPTQATDFEHALHDDATWLQEVDALEAHLNRDPDALLDIVADDHARTVLLRHTARTGDWEHLAASASDAHERAQANGPPNDQAHEVAQLARWMARTTADVRDEPLTRAELADTIAQNPWRGAPASESSADHGPIPDLSGTESQTP